MLSFPLLSPEPEGEVRPLPVSSVGRSGRLELRFINRFGRTVLGRLYQEVPFKVTRPHYSSPFSIARVILMHSTAGLFGGDNIEARIHVEAGARAMITSQSATKVHPSGVAPACQSLRITVEPGGELHYYVDPIIPFADSRLWQEIEVKLGGDAKFYYWDGLMAGRVQSGESWRFSELRSQTSVFVDAGLVYLDRFVLRPSETTLTRKWVMGEQKYLGNAIAYDGSLNENFLESVRAEIASFDHKFVYGIDIPSERLLIGRFLAKEGYSFRKARECFEGIVSQNMIAKLHSFKNKN